MTRRPSRRLAPALGVVAATLVAGWLGPAPAEAAATRSGSCVDGGGVRWSAKVTWGGTSTRDGVERIALQAASWTTDARGLRTDSSVRTYDGAGRRLQTLSWTGRFDYRDGTAQKSRNPLNPPSAPGRAKVVLSLGVDGDGAAGCSITFKQPVPASLSDRYESDVVRATNAERAERDLVVLRGGSCVDRYAEAQARAMADEQRIYHQDLDPVLEACELSRVGENVASGYTSGAAVTAAWMDSPGHRANLLEPRYRLLGVGAAKADDGRWYAAQVFGTAG